MLRHEIFLVDSVPTNINSSTFDLEELSQSDTEILELNLDQLLQESDNNSAPVNTVPSVNTITMLPSSTSRFKVTPTARELNAISEASTEKATCTNTKVYFWEKKFI
jgi:hypothetical protein